jgi:hypothetical protein
LLSESRWISMERSMWEQEGRTASFSSPFIPPQENQAEKQQSGNTASTEPDQEGNMESKAWGSEGWGSEGHFMHSPASMLHLRCWRETVSLLLKGTQQHQANAFMGLWWWIAPCIQSSVSLQNLEKIVNIICELLWWRVVSKPTRKANKQLLWVQKVPSERYPTLC